MVSIAVVGAGAVGLCSAVNAQMTVPNAMVTVIADRFGNDTVSSGAGGYFRPTPDPDQPNYTLMRKCSQDSWDFFKELARSPSAGEAAISTVYSTAVYDKPQDKKFTFIRDVTHDFQKLTAEQLHKRGLDFRYGYSFTTYIAQGDRFLNWLTKRFRQNGGKIQTRTVHSFAELYDHFDVVINCCGLGAKQLANDTVIRPIKGHIFYVKAPWIKQALVANDMMYILPQTNRVAVGVSKETSFRHTTVDPEVIEDIYRKAVKLVPELKGAERIASWAGLRPHRDVIRLELENMDCGAGRTLPVVYNYGHGSFGIALSWGTAVHAVSLAAEVLHRKGGTTSKL